VVTSLYGIRTADGLFIVDVAAGLMLHAPFTITPTGQPEWQPATPTLDTRQGEPLRPIGNKDALDDATFWGGILRSGDEDDGERILWCVPLRVFEDDPIQAGLVIAGGFVFASDETTLLSRLQPGGASALVYDIRDLLSYYAKAGPVLAFEVPRGFMLMPGRHRRYDPNRTITAESGSVTLFVTTSVAVHAISATGRWSKITSRSHAVPASSGRWHSALIVAVPPRVIDAVGTVEEAIRHPDVRPGIEQVALGDSLYLHTHAEWTLTTPIIRGLTGILVDQIDDHRTYLVAGPDGAWIVEDNMLLPVHDGVILPAPRFLAVGDRIENTLITCVVRLQVRTAPS
jgi:hypothetical protein